MRKLYTSVLIVLFFSAPLSETLADTWYKKRTCNWVYKRYKVKAETWGDWFGFANEGGTDKGCDRAERYVRWDQTNYTRCYSKMGIYQVSSGPFVVDYENFGEEQIIIERFSPNGHDRAGYAPIHRPSAYTAYPVVHTLQSTKKSSIADVYLKSTEDIIYDEVNHAIIVRGTQGHMMLNPEDIANEFVAITVSLTYEPESYMESQDPVIEEAAYVDNLVWSSRAIFNNGSVAMSGAFKPDLFQVVANDGQGHRTKVAFRIDEMVIPVPAEYDLEELSVNFGADAGNLGWGISKKFAIPNPDERLIIHEPFFPSSMLDFSYYPNPTDEVINIDAELPYTDQVTISIYDIDGNFVKDIYQGKMWANHTLKIRESLAGLERNRVYFLEMRSRKQRVIRKLIFQ